MRDPRNRHAAVIGINGYGRGIVPLRTAVADARAVAETLEHQHGYTVECLLDEQADRFGIEDLLQGTLPVRVDEKTAFLLYFAGHGLAVPDQKNHLQGFLLPHDAEAGDESTWLAMASLVEQLQELPCEHLLVILDCCFAGSFRWSTSRNVSVVGRPLYDSQYRRFLEGTAWHALTSAAHNEKALDMLPGRANWRDADSEDASHSPFARALIDALKTGNADAAPRNQEPDGVVTVTELHQFISHRLFETGIEQQTPGLWDFGKENKGEYIFYNPDAPINIRDDPAFDADTNPWLGLKTYSIDDEDRFFGRRDIIDALEARIRDSFFVAVVGPSGSGKSSLLRAGVVPRLLRAKTGAWPVRTLRPGRGFPLAQLEEGLKTLAEGSPRDRLLIIDQFEELFTQITPAHRKPFLDRLLKVIQEESSRVVITLRSDFEAQLRDVPKFRPLVREALFIATPPTLNELREIILGPAELHGIFFESNELVDEIAGSVWNMPGALPMLSFALAAMYRNAAESHDREGFDRTLSREHYDTVGGVAGALHKSARDIYRHACDQDKDLIQWIFLRMVSDEGGRLARRRVHRQELERTSRREQDRIRDILERYNRARLITLGAAKDGAEDEQYIEPGHDTLVTAWPELQGWLRRAGSQALFRDVWRAAEHWQDFTGPAKLKRNLLWTENPRLHQLVDLKDLTRSAEWLSRTAKRLPWIARLAEQDRLARIEEHLTRRQYNHRAAYERLNALEQRFVDASGFEFRKRRLKRWVGTVGLIVILTVFSVVSWRKTVQLEASIKVADRVRNSAHRALSRNLLQQGRTDTASLVSLELKKPEHDPHSFRLLSTIVAAHGPDSHATTVSKPVAAAWGPDGATVLTVDASGELKVLSLPEAGARRLDQESEPFKLGTRLLAAAWSPDRQTLAAITTDAQLRLWRQQEGRWIPSETRRLLHRPGSVCEPNTVSLVQWHPSESRLLVVYKGEPAMIWDVRAGSPAHHISPNDRLTVAASWRPDGRGILTAGTDGVTLWTSDGEPERILIAPSRKERYGADALRLAVFSPRGRRVLAIRGKWVRLWDVHTAGLIDESSLADGPHPVVAWSPNGRWILLAQGKTAYLWDSRRPLEDRADLKLTQAPRAMSWSPSGERVLLRLDDGVGTWAMEPRLAQASLRARYGHCLTPREREETLQEPAEEASSRSGACELCMPVFFRTLETDASLLTARTAYQRCLETPRSHPWSRWNDRDNPLRPFHAEPWDQPSICRARFQGRLLVGEHVPKGCAVARPPTENPDPAMVRELDDPGPATALVSTEDFEVLDGQALRWVAGSRSGDLVGGRLGLEPLYICGGLHNETFHTGWTLDGESCWIAAVDPDAAKARAESVGPVTVELVGDFSLLQQAPAWQVWLRRGRQWISNDPVPWP